jgi:hypothetical protein
VHTLSLLLGAAKCDLHPVPFRLQTPLSLTNTPFPYKHPFPSQTPLLQAAGQVDVLINNGVSMSPGDIDTVTFDAFARTQVNNAGQVNHVIRHQWCTLYHPREVECPICMACDNSLAPCRCRQGLLLVILQNWLGPSLLPDHAALTSHHHRREKLLSRSSPPGKPIKTTATSLVVCHTLV